MSGAAPLNYEVERKQVAPFKEPRQTNSGVLLSSLFEHEAVRQSVD